MVQQNNAIDRNWREQRGAGANTPPGMLVPSTSEGDKRRQSLGPGRFVGTAVQYVSNDDGSPVADETNALLEKVLAELAELTVRPSISPELAKDIAAAIGTFS